MLYGELDKRAPLPEGYILRAPAKVYVIDRPLGAGGFALTYIAHEEGASGYVAIKELFPRRVEHGVAERSADGRIVIYDPAVEGPGADRAEAWDEVLPYLYHEAKMTKKASEVFRPDGSRDLQNAPDVFGVEGPFQAGNGNYYLVVDTAQGEPLGALIERGFVRDESGKIVSNGELGELLDVLMKLAQRLSRLHGDNEMLHLDLSPENIYVTRVAGGTEPVPVLIDYGSAYDRTGALEAGGHRYTRNQYSAPEILALADLNDEAAGYLPDGSSDTYSVVAILFYALTGKCFSTQTLFDPAWKKDLLNEYFYSGRDDGTERSFSKLLVSTIEKGLASDQRRRFRTADELYRALRALRRAYEKTGTLLQLIDRDELLSFAMLDKYPLYAYRSAGGDLDVLCLGSGTFVRQLILDMISCGQMLNGALRIHVVSNEYPGTVIEALKTAAPMLADYSDLERKDVPEDRLFVRFTFDRVSDLLDPAQCEQVAERYPFCRYVVIALGRNETNIALARMYGKALTRTQAEDAPRAVVLYYDAEDVAANVRSHVDDGGIADTISLVPFGDKLSAFASGIRDLGRRALRISYLYDLLSDPRQPVERSAMSFLSDRYGQRSSCAAALHQRYKLASIGINPAPTTNRRAIVAAYRRALKTRQRNELLYLEHRRWMMYMIADGFRLPTLPKIDEYSFKGANYTFKDTGRRLHPCLVPSGRNGIVLSSLPRDGWDKYRSYAEIDATSYDELDKMSLKLHFLARQKMAESRLLEDMRGGVGSALAKWEARQAAPAEQPEAAGADARTAGTFQAGQLRRSYDELADRLASLYESGSYSREIRRLDELEALFRNAGIDASAEFAAVRNDLKVFVEFSRYRDYKAQDSVIVDHLLWTLYARDDLALIKLSSRAVLDDVASALMIRPAELIYWGRPVDGLDDIRAFLHAHGERVKVSFVPAGEEQLDRLTEELETIVRRVDDGGKCILDITGGDPLCVAAAVMLAMRESRIGLVRYDEKTGTIENVRNCPEAGVYTMAPRVSANEVYSLFGAASEGQEQSYMRDLGKVTRQLWTFYREFQSEWEMVTAFFYACGKSPELKLKYVPGAPGGEYRSFVEERLWKDLKTDESFRKMESLGLIQDLSVVPWGSRLQISFRAPGCVNMSAFHEFFGRKIYYPVSRPFVSSFADGKDGARYVSLESGCSVDLFVTNGNVFVDRRRKNEGNKTQYAYAQVIPALRRLEEMGLIYDLRYDPAFQYGGGKTAVKLSFAYSNAAIQRCLMLEGNILELLAWSAADQTGYFDDCRPNFSFRWKEDVHNELDLVLTKGLRTIVVSCKTAKAKKEHLYEIRYLTERFSLDSIPVIIYTSSKMVDDSGKLSEDVSPIKERARAMGIYLIDMNEVAPEDLGDVFVQIAKGGYPL